VGLPEVAGYGGDQLTAAAQIARAAADHNFGADAQTLGIAVSMGESGLRPLNYGDAAGPNSRGYFQQRDWGPVADELDPYKSATMFFTGGQHGEPGLNSIAGWQTMTPTAAAHAVQRNADPNYYTKFYAPAQQVLAALGGSLPPSPGAPAGCPGTPVQAAGRRCRSAPAGGPAPRSAGCPPGSSTVTNPVTGKPEDHLGQDIANTCGTPIYAAAGGVNPDGTPNGKPATVIRSGPATGFGNAIYIDHGNGYITCLRPHENRRPAGQDRRHGDRRPADLPNWFRGPEHWLPSSPRGAHQWCPDRPCSVSRRARRGTVRHPLTQPEGAHL
jgi:hypothetical protein